MAKYRVQAPDGSIFQVEAPDGATEAQVLQYAQANWQPSRTTYPEERLGSALQKAHQAGDTEGARKLADQIRWQRSQAQGGRPQSQTEAPLSKFGGIPVGAQPQSKFGGIPVDTPSGAGRGDFDDLIPGRRWQFDPVAQPWENDEIVAPAGGDFDDLIPKRGGDFDDLIPKRGTTVKLSQLQGAPGRRGTAKLSQVMAQSRRPDFSNVQGGVSLGPGVSRRDPLEVRAISGNGRPYTGPLLADNGTPGLDTTSSTLAARAELERRMAQPRLTPEQAKQRAFRELPAPVRALVGVGSSVGRLAMGTGQVLGLTSEADALRQRQNDAYMQGDLAATLGSVAGDVGLTLAPGGAVARTMGTTGRAALAGNAALGAGYAALQPVVQGESRAQNAAVGAAFGAGGQLTGDALGHMGRRAAQAVPDATKAMARRAINMGIPLHASQVSDSLPVKVAASAGKYLPFSGYAGAAKRQQEGFNRAVGQTFGVDATKLTDDVMRDARQVMSRQFEEIYGRNAVPITEKAARKLSEIEREASRRLTNDEAQVLRNQLDDILANAEDGVFTGQKYQAVRTSLKKAEDKTKLGQAVRDMRMALDDLAADSVGPQDAAVLKKLRSQWANFRTVENARKQNAGASDDIRPGSLWPLIRNGSTQEMRELARIGQTLLRDPIADSGTAQRSLIYNLLMGGGSIGNPALIPMIGQAALGGATLGRAANSNALARMLVRESMGVPTNKLAKMLQEANPRAMPAAGAAYNRAGLEFDVTGGRPISDEEFEREHGFRP